jgi:hypothetical protein
LAGQKTEVCDWTLGRISSMEQTRTRYKLAVMGKSPRGSISVDILKVCISLEMNNFEHLRHLIVSPHNFLPSIVPPPLNTGGFLKVLSG